MFEAFPRAAPQGGLFRPMASALPRLFRIAEDSIPKVVLGAMPEVDDIAGIYPMLCVFLDADGGPESTHPWGT